MISTASIEPASMNAELSWKTVTKGFRNTTRRPRKIYQSLNIDLQHDDKITKEKPSVTKSEEFGVAVLGNRFSEKIDHLPIKKRRLTQQSLPPPPRVSYGELNADPGKKTGALDGSVPVVSSRDEKSFVNRNPLCSVDCYGIQLLAAAACNTSTDDEVHEVKAVKVEENVERLPLCGVSIQALVEDKIGYSQKENLFLKDIKVEDHTDSGEQNNSPVVSEDIREKSASEAGKSSSSRKDVRLHWDLNTVMDEWELPPENTSINSSRNGSVNVCGEGLLCGKTEKMEGRVHHRDPELACELLKCPSEIDVSAQVVSKLKCSDSCLFPGSNSILSESPFLEKLNAPTTEMTVKVEDHCLRSDLQLGQTIALENVQLGKHNIAMVDPTISEKSVCNVVRLKFDKDKFSDVPNGRSTINLTQTASGDEDRSRKSGKVDPSFEKGRKLAEKQDIKVPSTVGAPVDSSLEVEVKKLEHKCYDRSHEDSLDDLLDDGDVSDYSPTGHHHLVIIKELSKYHSGYESPVEDGELRESFVHSWQEKEDETDCLDFDVVDRDAADEKVTSGKNDSSKESSHSVTTRNSPGRNHIYEGCEHVAKTVKRNNMKSGEVGAFDSTHKFEVKGSLEEKVGSMTRGKLSMHLHGLSGSRAFDENNTRDVQRSSAACFQDGKVYRSDKFVRDRDIHDADVSVNWDSRNHCHNGCRRGGGNPWTRRSNSPDANYDELAYDDQRRFKSNYVKGGYQPLNRRRPSDNNHNSMNRGDFATRDGRHYNTRGRAGFYRHGFVKDNRDDYHDLISNGPTPSPIYNRDTAFSRPYRKSPSRSRTGSPVPWHLQRERNMGPKRLSRSPNFSSEGRIGRNRMQYDDSKFSENDDGLLSPPRRRFFNDQNGGLTRSRERNSPGRFFGQCQRFDSNGTGGRMKTDDGGFTPRLNPERFSEKSGGGWRGNNNNNINNYDGSDSERTRYNNKHEMIRRVRHSETGGAGRRFRSDADDCFKDSFNCNEDNNKNSCVRNIEKSDALGNGNSWERERDFKCDGDRAYNKSSKLPGIRSCED